MVKSYTQNTNPMVGARGLEGVIKNYRLDHATSENDTTLEKLEYLIKSF